MLARILFMYARLRPTLVLRNLLIPVALLASAWHAQAVQWTLTSAGPPTWTYTLTFDPLDNCNLFVSPSTITMTGLTGVTAAGAPTSSDFPSGSLDTNNRNWVPQVLNGGTKVVWTNTTCGTGNFGVAKHVIGFTVTAAASPNGTASFATTGMAKDTGSSNSLDVSGSVAGPASTGTPAVPAASPLTLVLLSLGLGAASIWQVKRQMHDRLLPRE
jgi:hypothetical protein